MTSSVFCTSDYNHNNIDASYCLSMLTRICEIKFNFYLHRNQIIVTTPGNHYNIYV